MIAECVELIDDPVPRDAVLNMAIDEALLESLGEVPLLRVYRWARPAVSFGCFEPFAAVRDAYPAHELVRRWTAGGVVEHGADVTYSVLASRRSALGRMRPAESYRAIHGAIAREVGAQSAPEDRPKVSHACFENPVRHDLLLAGRKIAGAAQRRTREGFLHQGSILADISVAALAGALAGRIVRREPRAEDLRRAHELVIARYGAEDWLMRRA